MRGAESHVRHLGPAAMATTTPGRWDEIHTAHGKASSKTEIRAIETQTYVLARRAHTRITNNANADTSGKPTETVGETGSEVSKSKEVWVVLLHDLAGHDDCGDTQENEDPVTHEKTETGSAANTRNTAHYVRVSWRLSTQSPRTSSTRCSRSTAKRTRHTTRQGHMILDKRHAVHNLPATIRP